MTIRRGRDWGTPGPLAPHARVCEDDAQVAAALQAELDAGESPGALEVGLTGGDLHRTLGAPRRDAAALLRGDGVRCPVDAALVRLDGRAPQVVVAHVVGTSGRGHRWWRGPTLMVMNAAFVGPANVAPRSHPNDGRLDVVQGSLPLRQRIEAHRRVGAGAHLPHPGLSEARVRELDLDLGPRGLHVTLDGVEHGRVHHLRVQVVPDALVVVV